MGRYVVITWDGAGNLVPTLGIAQRLVERGHRVPAICRVGSGRGTRR
jgi:UDP:flavonoid glycosyltransferase YjiC (YdhE family)